MLRISVTRVILLLVLLVSTVTASSVRRRSILEPPEGPYGCREIPECDPNKEYRTADGSCNNLKYPLLGASHTPFNRYLPPQYSDDNGGPRLFSVEGKELPPARLVSTTMSSVIPRETISLNTLLVMQWGQYIDHDLTFTPEPEGFECCDDGQNATITDPDCMPLDVSFDPFFNGRFGIKCRRFVRSRAVDSSCGLEHREQVNALTSYIDGSEIYGSTQEEQDLLRSFSGGQLRIGPGQESEECEERQNICPLTYLPVRTNAQGLKEFFGGDRRVEEQPGLTSMHTLFARAHNDIASQIENMFPEWDDEKLFQETRRIVYAITQQITYNEHIPAYLGFRTSAEYNLLARPHGNGPYDLYDPERFNPATPNVFSSVVFRFGHSLISNTFLLPGNYRLILAQNFFNHTATLRPGQSPSNILRGQSADLAERMDHFVIETLTNKLFAHGPDFEFGEDLYSRNINRARDHGIPPYNDWRERFGLKRLKDFKDLYDVMPEGPAEALESIYDSVDDIDLFAAGISETTNDRRDGILGPLFSAILATRFQELKYSDRFFYENERGNPRPFTTRQLDIIKRTRLSSMICAYTDALFMQRFAMQIQSFINPLENCEDILRDSVPWNVEAFFEN